MSYLDVYKKKLQVQGGSTVNERKKIAEDIMFLNFKDDPSYYKGILKKSDLSEVEIELRMVNTSKSNIKKMYLLPNTNAHEGDYIQIVKDEVTVNYLVTDFEDNLISKCSYVTECNQVLKLPSGKEYPCVISNDSYGSKINSSNDILSEIDTKLKIQVQCNEDTLKECDLDIRYMFNSSKFDIYKTTDINTSIKKGMLTMISQKDKFLPSLDRLEDNYCFQGSTDNNTPTPSTNYIIQGEDTIKINKEYTYTVEPQEGNITFALDEYTISENIAEIISVDSYSCTIKALKDNEIGTIQAIVNDKIVATFDFVTVKY